MVAPWCVVAVHPWLTTCLYPPPSPTCLCGRSISSPGVHTVAVAVPVAVERPPVGAATSTAGAGTGGGAGVVGSAAAGPAGAVPVSVAEEHVCTKCHNALEDGDVFCDNCGTRVT